jgi:hypothetical protein
MMEQVMDEVMCVDKVMEQAMDEVMKCGRSDGAGLVAPVEG